MKRPLATLFAIVCGSVLATAACAQNLVVTNAHIAGISVLPSRR
jgi:hypothetical protein